MNKKILIVGGVAGGASAAARLRRLNEKNQIIMFERGPHVSFSNCSLPYHLSGIVEDADDLILMKPEKFLKQYNIEARVNHEVLSIDRAKKEVIVKNLETKKEYRESYDNLILSPGAKAMIPNIPGIDKVNLFSIRNVVDIQKLMNGIHTTKPTNIAVIGGGFIGVEAAENLKEAGYSVTLIEALPQILKPFDEDMVQILHKEIYDRGIQLVLGDKVTAFEEDRISLESGRKVYAEIVIMAIGVIPEVELAKEAGLEIGKTGGIKVDPNYQTSDQNIYAVGDAIEVYHRLTGSPTKLALAGPAQKQARSVADHIHGMPISHNGVIGTSVIKVFDYNAAATGLNEGLIQALSMNIDYDTIEIIPNDKVGLMPDCESMHFKLIFEKPTGKVLGAQAIGKGNVDKRIDVIATVLQFGGTVEDLKKLELCYAPPFGTAKDVVNYAGYIASNLLHGSFKQVHSSLVRELVQQGACIIDVREKTEYAAGHIHGAKNIPLSEIRERIHEIPKEQPIYLHCRSGQRSYNAALLLQQSGFKEVYNVSAGFMGLCFYEYFKDQTTGRDKLVTEYNFL
ncbi:MAG: FAD-dependent oxidoreductase [Thermotaleaceae bacterium]